VGRDYTWDAKIIEEEVDRMEWGDWKSAVSLAASRNEDLYHDLWALRLWMQTHSPTTDEGLRDKIEGIRNHLYAAAEDSLASDDEAKASTLFMLAGDLTHLAEKL